MYRGNDYAEHMITWLKERVEFDDHSLHIDMELLRELLSAAYMTGAAAAFGTCATPRVISIDRKKPIAKVPLQ